MKKKTFKFFLLGIVFLFSLLIITSAVGKKVTITVCASDINWQAQCRDEGLLKALFAEVEKKINLTIKLVLPPNSQYKEKLNLLLTSGDKPDVFRVFQAMQFLPTYIARGDAIPLDDYIKKSKLASSIDPKIYKYIPADDGKIYYVPVNKPTSKFIMLRKDLVEKYGIKLSSTPTTEEFLNEMKKVVAADKKMIPFCFPKFIDNFQFFYNSFGTYGNIYPKDGKYIDGFNTPQAKEALVYIKKLYDEGVLDKEFITNENAKMRENLAKGLAVANIDYYFRYQYYIEQSDLAKAPTDFIPIYKLVGPRGEGGSLNEAIQDCWAISNTCKNPDAAFKFIENQVFNADIRQMTSIGLKNLHYKLDANGVISATEQATNSGYKLSANYAFESYPDFSNIKAFKWSEAITKSLKRQIEISKEAVKHTGPAYPAPAGKSAKFDEVNLSLKAQREATAASIVLGSKTLEDAYKEYENYWNSISGDKMLEELNKK